MTATPPGTTPGTTTPAGTTPGTTPGTATPGARPWPAVSRLRRLAPVALILLALVATGLVATFHGRGGAPAAPAHPAGATARIARTPTPPTYQEAAREHRTSSYNWGPHCDPRTGRLELPTVYAPPCVPVPTGGNGGSTWGGVSGDTITVVYYQPPPGGLAAAIQGAAGTPATNLATVEKYVAMFNRVFQTYGRHVKLVPYKATGTSTNAVAAHADAAEVGLQLHAFASIGGPLQTTAYENELARLHVLCVQCGAVATYANYRTDAPYLWASVPPVDTLVNAAASYIIHQLNGHDAVWAGEAAFRHEKRRLAVVNVTENPPPPGALSLTAEITRRFTAAHVNVALHHALTYELDLPTLPQQAVTLAAKLKASGATTVLFVGDPIMPIYLTRACAKDGYFPEWVISGTIFTDTSTLGRYYDQQEWSHAFGISSLAVPTSLDTSTAYQLYRWWYGPASVPPASKTAQVVLPPLLQFFEGVQLAGPDLTPYSFAAGLFRAPPAGGGPTTPLEAYGQQGAAPLPSYASPADYTFIWYDATAQGRDEEGTAGTGLMRYALDGQRFRDGTVPTAPVPMFTRSRSVTSYTTLPARDRTPPYPPWPGSPAAGP